MSGLGMGPERMFKDLRGWGNVDLLTYTLESIVKMSGFHFSSVKAVSEGLC